MKRKPKMFVIYILIALVLILIITLTISVLNNNKKNLTPSKATTTPKVDVNPYPVISDECTFDLTIANYNALTGPKCKGGYSRYNIKDVNINNKNLDVTIIYSDKNGTKSGLYINNTKIINKTDNLEQIGIGIFDNKLFILDKNTSNVLVYNKNSQNIYNLKTTLEKEKITDTNNQTITTEKIDPNGFSFANNQFNFKTSSGLYTVKFSGNKFETPNLIR